MQNKYPSSILINKNVILNEKKNILFKNLLKNEAFLLLLMKKNPQR